MYTMSDFMGKDDDLDAAFVCAIMISATTLPNLHDQLSSYPDLNAVRNKNSVRVNLRICVPLARLFEVA